MDGNEIDQADLLQRCMNDPAFVRQMLTIFREYAPKTLGQLRQTVDAADWPAARRHAHTLKGSAANVSAAPLRAVAMQMEKLIDESQHGEVAPKLEQLEAALARVLASIEQLLARPDSDLQSPSM